MCISQIPALDLGAIHAYPDPVVGTKQASVCGVQDSSLRPRLPTNRDFWVTLRLPSRLSAIKTASSPTAPMVEGNMPLNNASIHSG